MWYESDGVDGVSTGAVLELIGRDGERDGTDIICAAGRALES